MDRRWIRELITLFFVLNGIALMLLGDHLIPSISRGFWCGDETLKYPYQGDTFTDVELGLILFVASVIIFFVDGKLFGFKKNLHLINCYGYGLIINGCIVYILQIIMSQPRPHFFESCLPDVADSCELNTFVVNYNCEKYPVSRSITKSFPSAHSAYGSYHSLYLVWFLRNRLTKTKFAKFIPAIKAVLVMWGICLGLSRISDHRHHLSDVIVGYLIGAIVGVSVRFSFCKNFKKLA